VLAAGRPGQQKTEGGVTAAIFMLALVGIVALLIWAGIHFGGKWIDKMLCVRQPLDLSKPIVLPSRKQPEDPVLMRPGETMDEWHQRVGTPYPIPPAHQPNATTD